MDTPGVAPQGLTRQQELAELATILRNVRIVLEHAVDEDVIAASIELGRLVIIRVERALVLLGGDAPPPQAPRSELEDAHARSFGLAA